MSSGRPCAPDAPPARVAARLGDGAAPAAPPRRRAARTGAEAEVPAPDALRRLGRLPRAAGDVVVALGALVAARRAVRTTRIGALLAVADATAPVAHAVPPLGAREREAAWRWSVAVRRAAACAGGRITCLPRAIALQRLLARHGVHGCRVCIGVRRDGALAAHAWVERGGVVLGEPAAGVRGFALLVTGVTR